MSEGIVKEKSKLQKAFEDAGRELGRGLLTLSAASVGFVGSLYSMIKLNPNISFNTEKETPVRKINEYIFYLKPTTKFKIVIFSFWTQWIIPLVINYD